MPTYPSFAEHLKFYRTLAGLTQLELAKKLGVHEYTIGAYERGKSKPRRGTLDSLTEIFRRYFPDEFPEVFCPSSDNGRPSGSIRAICPHCKAANYHYVQNPIPGLELRCIACGCEWRPFNPAPVAPKRVHGSWHKYA